MTDIKTYQNKLNAINKDIQKYETQLKIGESKLEELNREISEIEENIQTTYNCTIDELIVKLEKMESKFISELQILESEVNDFARSID